MTPPARPLATWDLGAVRAGIGGGSLELGLLDIDRALAQLTEPPADSADAWESRLLELQALDQSVDHLQSYLYCELATGKTGDELRGALARTDDLRSRLNALREDCLGRLAAGESLDKLLARPSLAPVADWIRQQVDEAGRRAQQDPRLAGLACAPWVRLYGQLAGELTFPMPEGKDLPIAARRLAYGTRDAAGRDAAFAGVSRAWQGQRIPLAACLNGLAAWRLDQQGPDAASLLAAELNANRLQRQTLDGALAALDEAGPLVQEYLALKAAALGREMLGMQDLVVNPFAADCVVEDPVEVIAGSVAATLPGLAQSARELARAQHIQLAADEGGFGDFCAPFPQIGQCRVLARYGGQLADLNTLAHELGHAWHSQLIQGSSYWAQQIPTVLAESASTVAESVFRKGLLSASAADETAALVSLGMDKAVTYLLLGPSWFDFERALYDQRQRGELSPDQLDELMRGAQAARFGPAMNPDWLEPHGWMANHLFFDGQRSFYNFPYTVSYLLSLLIVQRLDEPGFEPRYRQFLCGNFGGLEQRCRSTLDIDLGDSTVWEPAISHLGVELNRLKKAVKTGPDSRKYPEDKK